MLQTDKLKEKKRRRIAAVNISLVCIGVLLLTSAASAERLPDLLRYPMYIIGGLLLSCGLFVLSWIGQDDGQHSFGHTGGFICPFVPLLPIACILINVYLLINLGSGTWIRVSAWLIIGVLIYLFYGRKHSSLSGAVYVHSADAEEIHRSPSAHS